MLLSFSGDKHENKHLLKCSHRVFSFATIRFEGIFCYHLRYLPLRKKWVDFTLTGPPMGNSMECPPRICSDLFTSEILCLLPVRDSYHNGDEDVINGVDPVRARTLILKLTKFELMSKIKDDSSTDARCTAI